MRLRISLPRLRKPRGHLQLVAICAVALCAHGVAAPRVSAAWPWSDDTQSGTAQWWKKAKNQSTFDPDKGYIVEGEEGYYDGMGRPMQSAVAVDQVIAAGKSTEEEAGLIPGLDPRVQYGKMKTAVGLGPNEQFARDSYEEGIRLFNEKEFDAAAGKFEAAISRGPNSPIEQDARFMLAESNFHADRYIKARDAYDELVKEHPNTKYLDAVIDREWKIARYWEELDKQNHDLPLTPNAIDKTRPWFDTLGHAIKTYENIRLNDPTGPKADDAIMATANIYFARDRFDDADYHYSLLRTEYPQSELQYEAHLLGLQAKLRKYQGEDYDGTPLEESKVLVKQLRVQFASRLPAEEKERLHTVEGQLNLELATRDYRMAEHYDGTKHYGAARHYYNEVLKDYPNTELATQARDRIAQIASEPDEPAKPLGAIVELFPQSAEKTRVARIPELKEGGRLATKPSSTGTTAAPAAPATTTR
jgi:outer membrane protein assembly factor BamD (BamD/ComL family)